jgi:hypothetical protein
VIPGWRQRIHWCDGPARTGTVENTHLRRSK